MISHAPGSRESQIKIKHKSRLQTNRQSQILATQDGSPVPKRN